VYRCEATSIEGFIQQLAVSYVGNGYWFYVAGSVPEGKDPRGVDVKLIQKYAIDISKWTRARRKRVGLASVQYLRFGRFFVLLATSGEHSFFREEVGIRDIRREPIRFAGYSMSYRKGRDEAWHPSVRIDSVEFRVLRQQFLEMSYLSLDTLTNRFGNLRFAAYAPIRSQYRQLWRAINRRRKFGAMDLLPEHIVPRHRRVVAPFEPLISQSADRNKEAVEGTPAALASY
jgi:hypothetical protein